MARSLLFASFRPFLRELRPPLSAWTEGSSQNGGPRKDARWLFKSGDQFRIPTTQTLPTHVSGPRALAGPRGPSGWFGGGGAKARGNIAQIRESK